MAKGLAYLHSRGPTRLAHGDIKASNILLDKNMEPKIADFGLARMCQNNERKVLTRIEGKRLVKKPIVEDNSLQMNRLSNGKIL